MVLLSQFIIDSVQRILVCNYCLFFSKDYLFGGENDRVSDLPSTGSLPKRLQHLGLGQVETRNLELYLDLLLEWREPMYMGHLLLLS